ncbi:hypothetical protein BGZ99_010477 [Dissophora globulifera]|uniref:Uncharacterized protein n=1 Tax=Dissophora globulifera TaxID=979702 RepID=A0A9P6RUL3_9FUNG|nr:hypothetical protein BGZ99_010477 [Dissophora globulifera]
MRFTAAISVLALASTVLADGWKNIGGDLAYVGPNYNATFKAGDTIPFEYTFYTIKIAGSNSTTPVNGTAPVTPSTGTSTLTSLEWVGTTGNQTLQVTFDNGRTDGLASPCLATDVCTGTYHPKRINLVLPSDINAGNYTIILGYTLSLAGNRTIYYKEPVNVVASSASLTSPGPVYPNAPSTTVTLPVFAASKSSGLVNQGSKVYLATAIMVGTAAMMLL